jgi:hypothetical protein
MSSCQSNMNALFTICISSKKGRGVFLTIVISKKKMGYINL